MSSSQSSSETTKKSVSVVVQRYRSCKLLLDESRWEEVGGHNEHCGLLVYVSFAADVTREAVAKAALTTLHLPVLTLGVWGDGGNTINVLDLSRTKSSTASIVIVPQANLISKVRSQGKSIQYHGQVEKEQGKDYYEYFVECIRSTILEHQCDTRQQGLPEWYQRFKQSNSNADVAVLPSTPPDQMFRDPQRFSAWEDDGMPAADAQGNELTKSAVKRLRKQLNTQKLRYAKWLERNNDHTEETEGEEIVPNWSAIDDSFCKVVSGSFGMRQGLEFQSDMGPFCHVLQL